MPGIIEVVNKYQGNFPTGVDIMRSGPLGNPHEISIGVDRKEALNLYRQYLWNIIKSGDTSHPVYREVNLLAQRYKNGEHIILVCCCKPQWCHGDILASCVKWIAQGGF